MFGMLEPDIYFYGQTIEKVGEDRYVITKGAFTTCVQPTPRWEIVSAKTTINLGGLRVLAQRRDSGQGRAGLLPSGLVLPDSERRSRDRLSAPYLWKFNGQGAVDQQRLFLGDQPQPGPDVPARLVYEDRTRGRRGISLRRGAGCRRVSPSVLAQGRRIDDRQSRRRKRHNICRQGGVTSSAAKPPNHCLVVSAPARE